MQTELGALELADGNLQSRAALAREFDHGFGSPPATPDKPHDYPVARFSRRPQSW